jgi:hypothetical protein
MNVNTEKKDILSRAELKKMPFVVPDGYFSDFHKEALKTTLASNGHVRTSARLRPFAAAAAALILLFSAGTLLLRTAIQNDGYSQEDVLVFSSNYINTIYNLEEERFAEAEITDEDIIEYLIYTGVDTDTIEHYK